MQKSGNSPLVEMNAEMLIKDLLSSLGALRDEVKSLQSQISQSGNKQRVYKSAEVEELLGVSPPTLRKWRQQGLIGYSQIDSTIIFTQQDIDEFLSSHHNEAYANA